MGRKVLAVILGYVVMAIVIMGGLTLVYLALGQDTVFEAGTYEVTGLWIVVWAIASVVAAVAGGFVCGKIGKSKGAVISLMILVAVLGAANTVYMMNREVPPENLIRVGDTSNMEAMTKAQAPTWMYIAEPLIGVFGAMFGASLGCGCRKDEVGEE
jgi:MFS family permease